MTKDKLIQLVFGSIPYPGQISDLDSSAEDAITFKWRSHRFRVSTRLSVDERIDGMLAGSDIAILLGDLLATKNRQSVTS